MSICHNEEEALCQRLCATGFENLNPQGLQPQGAEGRRDAGEGGKGGGGLGGPGGTCFLGTLQQISTARHPYGIGEPLVVHAPLPSSGLALTQSMNTNWRTCLQRHLCRA